MPVRLRLAQAAKAKPAKVRTMTYFIEINRCLRDASARFIRHLERCGLIVERLPHKTAYRIVRPICVTFADMRQALTAGLNPRLGSVLLFSASTGNAWVMSNRGNRRGVFVRM